MSTYFTYKELPVFVGRQIFIDVFFDWKCPEDGGSKLHRNVDKFNNNRQGITSHKILISTFQSVYCNHNPRLSGLFMLRCLKCSTSFDLITFTVNSVPEYHSGDNYIPIVLH